jgi:ABC-type Fe3+/spermidine/putrescine transport system ATPase subunit
VALGARLVKPFLTVSQVTKRFGSRAAVDDVSLDVGAGERVVIIGPSGCGKTTLLRLIAGLEHADGGEIWLSDQLASKARQTVIPAHGRGIGYVFQDLALWPHLTVERQLGFMLRATALSRAEQEVRIRESLELVKLTPLAARYPHQISGGEQQRAALARALVRQPRLLLLDEPFSSLDTELRVSLRDQLRRLQGAMGVAAIYVTHDRDDAAALADRVIEMRGGRIVADGPERRKETM